ncbi:terminase small subunit [Hymenobacter cellulosivorans]|uniref:Terminase small subunit n=1 Tax=Hymenobacter cellulosivorans TaxID=2932249 RepID=A0ABY4F967_9BACT|nr:terminase small subunit [Hymenobacter cellulosivorans]UOQ53068.1 terminase small subunit [Hymenobacter cellulosivorans]
MLNPENQPTPPPVQLTTKQQRFVEEYCVDWNCTQAAIRAGYAKKNAGQEGSRLYKKVEIKSAIDARLKELSLSAGQVTKLISDIAETRLNDFLTVKEVEKKTKIPQPLAETIRLLEAQIAFDEEYAARSVEVLGLLDEAKETYLASKQQAIKHKRLEVLRHQMTLERDPEAFIMVAGPPELVKRVDLDLVKIAEAKEGNRIKSWQPSEFGIKVEMYDAAAALRDMGRVHGIFEKDNSQANAIPVINAKVEVITSGVPIARSEKEAAADV